jgi:putative endonuclease
MVEQFPLKESVGGSSPPALTHMWSIYIVRCSDKTLYTGITTDIKRRIHEHNTAKSIGSKYVRMRRPVVLVYQETVDSRSSALKRETTIKKLPKLAKEMLISCESK